MKKINFALILLTLLTSCNSKKSNKDTENKVKRVNSDVTVVITDDSFKAPDSVPAGLLKLKLSNNSSGMHSAHLIKLDKGYTTEQLIKTYSDSIRTGGVRPKWMTHRGGVISEPGSSEIELLLDSGNYAWVCVMGDDSAPHFAGFEHKSFKVYGTLDKSQNLPQSDLTITMTDENFELSSPISKGNQSIEVVNSGSKYHLVAISRLNEDAKAEDVINWYTNYNGPPPARGIIATSAIGPELAARINVDFNSGEYVLFCMANAEGKFHLLDGAITSFTVK
ncbi:hypothetical protein [Robiginitalea sp. SC105]|uniref:hypothetical protein n=1 Tax=Robiginitalea sp. SC105 TaxID=2762332 RepID=UPI00163B1641|nr:hypothetical protein [Robiginitalea sp. SC105]MBC2839721.1 hypothetical protein [Robiginitalea sp. SC105]